MALTKAAVLLFSLVLLGCATAEAGNRYHPYSMPPTYAPVQPPAVSPTPPIVKSPPPKQPPHKPPTTPPPHPPPHAKPPSPTSPSYTPPTPTPPPSKSPTYSPPPSKPPTKSPPPAKPPTHPPKSQRVAVQGVVFCKSCNTTGINTLNGASPHPGARVALKCVSKYFHTKAIGVTDKNGYFFMFAPRRVTSAIVQTCKVFLAPRGPKKVACRKPTTLNDGLSGAILKPQETFAPLPYSLYTVGPFAYEPHRKCPYGH